MTTIEDLLETSITSFHREMSALADNQCRIESRHEERMNVIVQTLSEISKSNTREMSVIYDRLDDMNKKMDSIMMSFYEKSTAHAIDLASLKTTIAMYSTVAGVIAATVGTWVFNNIFPNK